MLISTEGFILKNRKYGEADSLLTIFTRKIGKVNAIAKGSRRSKSSLLAGTQAFCYSDFVLYKGKSLYTVSQCDVKEVFYPLREDLKKLSYAAYLIELVECLVTEGQTNNRLFNLLGKTLYILKEEDIEIESLIRAFEIKSMDYSGYRPYLINCVNCGKGQSKSWRFSGQEGGIVCSSCFNIDQYAMKIRDTSIKLAIYLLTRDMLEIKDLKVSKHLNRELRKILGQFIASHTNKYSFKSLEVGEKL